MAAKSEYKKGLWTVEEDNILAEYIRIHGKGKWNRIARVTGLKRCGKSCRLRWVNYLSPHVKRSDFSEEENDLIIRLHSLLGNRWSLIAGRLPGRTDNQVKNHWNSHLSKRLGVIKSKSKAAGTSSQLLSKVPAVQNFSTLLESNSAPAPHCINAGAVGQEVAESGIDQSVAAAGFNSAQVQEVKIDDDNYEESFWFSNDDLYLQFPNNLLDFLVWDGL